MLKVKFSLLSVACVLSLSVLLSAHAAPLVIGGSVEVGNIAGDVFTPTPVAGDANGLSANVKFTLNGITDKTTYAAGLFVLDQRAAGSTGSWSQLLAFCLEPDAFLMPFHNPYAVKSLSGSGYTAVSGALSELWGRYYGQVTNDLNAAAFQVAVWELAYGTTDKNLSSGDFILNTTGTVKDTAQLWLKSLDGDVTKMAQGLVVLQDNETSQNNKQDLLAQGEFASRRPDQPLESESNNKDLQAPSEVPEPGMLGLLAAGLAGLGLSRRRVRHNSQT